MNISIKGKLRKVEGEWISEFTHLNISVKAPSAFKSIMAMSNFIKSQLEGKDHKCSIRLDEEGVFFFTMSKPKPLIKFIALCLTKNYSEMSYEQLNEWFWVDDELQE